MTSEVSNSLRNTSGSDLTARPATNWRTSRRTYPPVRGTNQLAVTPEQFDEALEAYAAVCKRELLAALNKCDTAFVAWQVGQIPGRPEDILALITEVRAVIAAAEGRQP